MIIKDIRYTWTEKSIFENKKIQNIKGSICFTGALSISRGEASNLAEAAGFEIKNAVTKGLTYLVTPDPNSGSSKNEKAKKYGTKVIDEKTFMNLIKTTDDSIMDF
jgi:NAD-dependent DNA ligase